MLNFLKKLFGMGSSTDFQALIQNGAIILDVRTSAEFKNGHVEGAMNIPVQELNWNIEKVKKMNKPVITCCASGMRSSTAASMLKSQGIDAYNGGTWQNVNRYK